MTSDIALGPSWLDPQTIIDSVGLIGLLLVVFAESGLLVGFFLPGDSLLFTAGLLVAADADAAVRLNHPLWLVLVTVPIAAIVGDQVGYAIGRKAGPSVFNKPESRFFRQSNVERATEFFDKYGGRAVVLARFVPIVRTFTPVIAGVSRMHYRTFITYNMVGGLLWGVGVTVLGYWLGQIDFVAANIELILLAIVAISVLPIVVELLRARAKSRKSTAAS